MLLTHAVSPVQCGTVLRATSGRARVVEMFSDCKLQGCTVRSNEPRVRRNGQSSRRYPQNAAHTVRFECVPVNVVRVVVSRR